MSQFMDGCGRRLPRLVESRRIARNHTQSTQATPHARRSTPARRSVGARRENATGILRRSTMGPRDQAWPQSDHETVLRPCGRFGVYQPEPGGFIASGETSKAQPQTSPGIDSQRRSAPCTSARAINDPAGSRAGVTQVRSRFSTCRGHDPGRARMVTDRARERPTQPAPAGAFRIGRADIGQRAGRVSVPGWRRRAFITAMGRKAPQPSFAGELDYAPTAAPLRNQGLPP